MRVFCNNYSLNFNHDGSELGNSTVIFSLLFITLSTFSVTLNLT